MISGHGIIFLLKFPQTIFFAACDFLERSFPYIVHCLLLQFIQPITKPVHTGTGATPETHRFNMKYTELNSSIIPHFPGQCSNINPQRYLDTDECERPKRTRHLGLL